jgi:site-specific recombinase XerD
VAPVRVDLRWEHGRLVAVESTSADVAHFLELVRVRNPYNTWVNYACDLKVFFRLIPKLPDQVTREDCVRFMSAQGEANLAVSTINRRLATLSSLFDELLLRDPARFPENPVSPRMKKASKKLYKRNPRRVPDVLPEDELRALFGALPTWRDRTLLLLQWVSCLRISEVVAIRFEDVECSHKRIHIRASKNHEARTVYMNDETFTALNHYLDHERAALERAGAAVDEEAIFLAFRGPTRGRQLSVNAIQKLLVYYAAKCALPHVHAHLLRHTGITQLLEAGMAEATVRALVGHKRPESLQPYTHLHDTFVEAEFRRSEAALTTERWITDLTATDEAPISAEGQQPRA